MLVSIIHVPYLTSTEEESHVRNRNILPHHGQALTALLGGDCSCWDLHTLATNWKERNELQQ